MITLVTQHCILAGHLIEICGIVYDMAAIQNKSVPHTDVPFLE